MALFHHQRFRGSVDKPSDPLMRLGGRIKSTCLQRGFRV